MAKDKLTTFRLDKPEEWDAIVRSFAEHDTYWLSGYVHAFELHGDGEPLLLHYDSDVVRGINVVMKRDVADDPRFTGNIPKGKYWDFTSPYGYGGWLIEGNDSSGIFDAYECWVRKNGVVSEFVRFHPMLSNHVACEGFYKVIRLGEVVHMDLSSPNSIWSNLTSKNRNVIRKAIKSGVRIYNGRFPEIYRVFREIYNGTMDKDQAREYYYFGEDFYASICEDLPHNAQVFWAEKDGMVIAASIMLACNGRMNYHLSGSLREYSSLAATNLLLYEAALWGYANGCRTLYLGGGVGSGQDSLFKFKRAFYRGELNSFHIGRKIFDQARYDELCAIRGEVKDKGFFPRYRG